MKAQSSNKNKMHSLTVTALTLTMLMSGTSLAEQLPETPYPDLGTEIAAQGQSALTQLSNQQRQAANWQQKANNALTAQLEQHEFQRMLAGTSPCEQKKNQPGSAVKEAPQPATEKNQKVPS